MPKYTRRGRGLKRKQRGGQAPIGDSSMLGPSSQSLAQGANYGGIHANQHGGVNMLKGGAAPLDAIGSTLPQELQGPAGVSSTMTSMNEIRGMSDQTGGGHRKGHKGRKASRKGRKASRKGRKASRKGRKASRKGRKASRKGRKASRKAWKMWGGAMPPLAPAGVSEPGQLVPSSVSTPTMHPEWKLAEDPTSFAPKMSGGAKRRNKNSKSSKRTRRSKRRSSKKWFGLF